MNDPTGQHLLEKCRDALAGGIGSIINREQLATALFSRAQSGYARCSTRSQKR
jgi:hypothetical protein